MVETPTTTLADEASGTLAMISHDVGEPPAGVDTDVQDLLDL